MQNKCIIDFGNIKSMKTLVRIILIFILMPVVGCINAVDDETAKQAILDSIARADSIARLDSIVNVVQQIRIDSIKRIKAEEDSATIVRLTPKFRKIKDEFDEKMWYKSKTAPQSLQKSYVYLLFEVTETRAGNLRMKIQYAGSDWVLFDYVHFYIDGNTYTIDCFETQRDNSADWVWERYDFEHPDNSLLKAMYNASSVKVKYEGDDKSSVRILSERELNAIKETIDLYKAMGGYVKL